MKKASNFVFIAVTISSLFCLTTIAEAANASNRWYSGYQSPSPVSSWNYDGVHSTITTPSTNLYLDMSSATTMSTNFINMDIADGTATWWLQAGFTHGYDSHNVYNSGYTAYTEYGIVRADLSTQAWETMLSNVGNNVAWDYWVRWDNTQGAWKVNVNNSYTGYFLSGFSSYGRIEADGEVNASTNKNYGVYNNNTYYNSTTNTWTSFDSTSFTPYHDIGSTVTGTPTSYTVSR